VGIKKFPEQRRRGSTQSPRLERPTLGNTCHCKKTPQLNKNREAKQTHNAWPGPDKKTFRDFERKKENGLARDVESDQQNRLKSKIKPVISKRLLARGAGFGSRGIDWLGAKLMTDRRREGPKLIDAIGCRAARLLIGLSVRPLGAAPAQKRERPLVIS
jgi:hypothetical protein